MYLIAGYAGITWATRQFCIEMRDMAVLDASDIQARLALTPALSQREREQEATCNKQARYVDPNNQRGGY
jgi:hypothetical protein